MKFLLSVNFILVFIVLFNQAFAQCFSEQNFISPGESTYILPGDASQSYLIEIEARGADGGDFLWGSNPQTDGGEGALMKGSFIIPGGSNLLVIVGSSGLDAPGSPGGGGGGGGTAVIMNNTDVLIAAGAGGGGGQGALNTGQGGQANTNSAAQGGAGLGSSGGGGFNSPGGDGPASFGGGAGTLTGQGIGGAGGITAGSGGSGFGGGGGGSGTVGGGGGGYKGGDGSDGSTDLNGKGGDSFVNTLFSGTVIFNTAGQNGGGANLNGYVTITCIPQSGVEISLVEKIDPLCSDSFDGSIEVSATGGLGPYQYALNGGGYVDSPIFSNLSAGNYTVSVQDATGGTDQLMVTLVGPAALLGELISVVDNVCFGASDGSIEVSASGGTTVSGNYGYSINGSSIQNSGVFINLLNGFYVISIFDDNLCTTQVSTSITSPDDLDIVVISKTDLTCSGMDDGSIAVEAFGGTGNYEFSIDGQPFESTSQFFDLMGGTHIITVMDEEGCTENIIVFLAEPGPLTYELEVNDLACFGDNDGEIKVVNINGTEPFLFKINEEETTSDSIFTGLTAGEYIITVIDSSGCEWIQDVEILSPDSLILSVVVVMGIECDGDSTGAVMLELQNGVGDVTYSVDQTFNFTGSFENLPAGVFLASAIDANGCNTEQEFEIQESATFTVTIDSVVNVSCFGGSDGSFLVEVMDAIEPIQYALDGVDFQDMPFFNNLEAGLFSLQVIDSTGCTNTIEVLISEPDLLQFEYMNIEDVACNGDSTGSISLSVTGGSSAYMFNDSFTFNGNDTITIDSLAAGGYVLSVNDVNGCNLIDSVFITENDSLQLFISALEGDDCGPDNTGTLDLNATGGLGPLTFSLNNGPFTDGVYDSLGLGNYVATVFDSLGCNASINVNIPQLDGLILDSLSIGNVSCNGASDGFVEFFVSNGSGNITIASIDIIFPDLLIEDLAGGDYYFTAQDEKGCFIEIEVVINEPDPLNIEVMDANMGEGYITVMANGGTEPYRYSIDDKMTTQDSSTFTGLEPGDYTIIVIDGNGCENSVVYTLVGTAESEFLGLKIYPNPAYSNLFVEFEDLNSEIEIDIISNTGQVLKKWKSGDLKLNSTVVEIPLGEISQGSHIMKISNQNRVVYRRFVKVK